MTTVTESVLKCPECGMEMHLKNSKHGKFYGCSGYPDCEATHGAHHDGRPLGTPATKDTRQARMSAHISFDRLWEPALRMYEAEGGPITRSPEFLLRVARTRAYAWLAWRLGMKTSDAHIGSFDAFHCDLVRKVCKGVKPEDVRRWAKSKRHRERIDKIIRMHGSEQHEMGFVEEA